MNGWLLDTNVLSELRRAKPNASVTRFVSTRPFARLYVSVVTLAEIRFGIEVAADIRLRMEVAAWLAHQVRPMFENRVLDITEDIVLTWRLLVEKGRKIGHTYSQEDLMIAATARHHGLTIVSRDTREYERAEVPVVNPWMS
ncbi:MAG: type II toxin-antitoxin system VapC family toxin [Acidobacteria bacterium]|nr:type II toxin-antitoxin system VapC family toxin [Acidobacteriota bacterium]MBV9068653.1 type II toxin-antitoxin system VapC family toxin [Acidobacteriota bacterium]MBV9186060.1 type II toxin-antitoxin system VapC family toxin [Acidobacteriota bacterium]